MFNLSTHPIYMENFSPVTAHRSSCHATVHCSPGPPTLPEPHNVANILCRGVHATGVWLLPMYHQGGGTPRGDREDRHRHCRDWRGREGEERGGEGRGGEGRGGGEGMGGEGRGGEGREGKGREGKGREGEGEGKGREGK